VGPLERKTPLDGGKVEFNFVSIVGVGGVGGRVMVSVSVADA